MEGVAESSIRSYESALAQELADGHARLRDLETAAAELAALDELLAGEARDTLALEALYCTAAVRYRRFFISSSRENRGLVRRLEEAERRDHDLLLAAANQQLTHPLAAFAECRVGVSLSSEDSETAQLTGTVVIDRPAQPCTRGQVARYRDLIDTVRSLHAESLEQLRHRLEAEVRAFSVDLLLGLPPL